MNKVIMTTYNGIDSVRIECEARDCPFCGNPPSTEGVTIGCECCGIKIGQNFRSIMGIHDIYFNINTWNGKVEFKDGKYHEKFFQGFVK